MNSIGDLLRTKGVLLNPPLVQLESSQLSIRTLIEKFPDVISMLQSFNGFKEWHFNSQITIWTFERILAENDLGSDTPPAAICIGDHLLDSDLLDLTLCDGVPCIKYRFAGTKIADGVVDLLEKIANGELDE